jgi:3-oxoacid CoA-transferase A subunit
VVDLANKIYTSFDEAIADIPDRASIAIESWGFAATAQNLIAALRRRNIKDLTLITHNFIPSFYTEEEALLPVALLPQLKKLVAGVIGIPQLGAGLFIKDYVDKGLEVELTSHGILASRLYAGAAGLGGIYTPVGIGTVIEEGKEKRIIDGKDYIFEKPIRPDYAFIVAHKADRMGNLVYLGTFRADQPIMAMAARTTIVEAEEVVEAGTIDPEHIVTPGIFVDRIVEIPEGGYGTIQKRKKLVNKFGEMEVLRKMLFG